MLERRLIAMFTQYHIQKLYVPTAKAVLRKYRFNDVMVCDGVLGFTDVSRANYTILSTMLC